MRSCGVRNEGEVPSPTANQVCLVECVGACGVCNAGSRCPQCVTGVVRNGAELPCPPESLRCGVCRCLQCSVRDAELWCPRVGGVGGI